MLYKMKMVRGTVRLFYEMLGVILKQTAPP